ncbi:MAG: alanine--tRNA ligase-related protein [Candidatus Saccharimonadales bacterium]
MTAQEIRQAYVDFFAERRHAVISRAPLVPYNDPTTLFTGSGMQPLVPYLLGEPHAAGKRLVDSQTCLRAQDIEEVGNNRHTTFFEMLGNWSLGDYFKQEQLPWLFEFLTDIIGLDPQKLYVTAFLGAKELNIPKDVESGEIWKKLFTAKGVTTGETDIGSEADGYKKGMPEGARIFYYDASKNWWCRAGSISGMPAGEPGGPDSEVFYEFDDPTTHDAWVETLVSHKRPDESEDEIRQKHERCHPNCDCGRFLEIGNSVFMEYVKTADGFEKLPKQNVDFGGGLERIAAAKLNSPDVFKISLLRPIIAKLEEISGKNYDSHTQSMRVIADHLRAATFLAVDGITPSNKEQGYVMRRLLRRAIRFAFELGIEQNFLEQIVPVIADLYTEDFPEVVQAREKIIEVLTREEKAFRQTLRKALKELDRISQTKQSVWKLKGSEEYYDHKREITGPKKISIDSDQWEKVEAFVLTGQNIFNLSDTYGFPHPMSTEEAAVRGLRLTYDWTTGFREALDEQRARSQTASKGTFKGGLGGQTLQHKKYHTATHLMYQALRDVLGDHVVQRGSNITEERLRFDFSHSEKMTSEQIKQAEDIVNEQIAKDLKVSFEEYPTKVAVEEKGALGQFGDRYGETVKVYKMIADGADKPFSFEICGGPHVDHTAQLAEGGKHFKIIKEESSSAGIRRIKAVLE